MHLRKEEEKKYLDRKKMKNLKFYFVRLKGLPYLDDQLQSLCLSLTQFIVEKRENYSNHILYKHSRTCAHIHTPPI